MSGSGDEIASGNVVASSSVAAFSGNGNDGDVSENTEVTKSTAGDLPSKNASSAIITPAVTAPPTKV